MPKAAVLVVSPRVLKEEERFRMTLQCCRRGARVRRGVGWGLEVASWKPKLRVDEKNRVESTGIQRHCDNLIGLSFIS